MRALIAAISLLLIAGCATLPRDPVPVDRAFEAEIPEMPGVRAWGGIQSESFQADFIESHFQESPGQFPLDADGNQLYDGLALSGGGATGAFGAGFLNGWSQAGNRPDFKIVTGISTGALIAPFAFLGERYDDELRTVFTTVDSENILERLSLFSILFRSESLASTGPLRKLIEAYMDDAFIAEVAARHNRGYRLYIGTHHMDAQRLVVWNMGMIANSEAAGASELFRDVILASASIPIVFPPVLIQSNIDGTTYDEMHVDGGVSTQVFFYAGTININEAIREALGEGAEIPETKGDLYVIRNGQVGSSPQVIERRLQDISGRSVDSMIKTAAVGDLYRMKTFAERDGVEFFYVDVPDDFVSTADEPFDREEMNELFRIGFELGASGDAWQTEPPGLTTK